MGATELAAGGWRSVWPSGRYRRGLVVGLVVLVAAGAVVAASDATFTGGSDESASAPGSSTAEIAPADSSATGGDGARSSLDQATTAASIAPAAVQGTTPRVVRRAQLDIEVAGDSLAAAFDRVSGVADRLGVSSSARPPAASGPATPVLATGRLLRPGPSSACGSPRRRSTPLGPTWPPSARSARSR